MTTTPFRPDPDATPARDAGLEALSAFVDGELHGDAARFASKRLEHDAQLRATAGRWQLMGDVLRGQAVAAAPGLPERVDAALSTPDVAPATGSAPAISSPVARRTHRRWAGSALAASVALVAFVGLRPDATPPVASAPAIAEAPRVAPQSRMVARTPADASTSPAPAAGEQNAPTAVERAPVARAIAAARARAPARDVERARAAAPPPSAPITVDAPRIAAVDPFRPSGESPFAADGIEPVARPWPRATLPALQGNGDMRATQQRIGAPSPYYPFEPRLPVAPEPAVDAPPLN